MHKQPTVLVAYATAAGATKSVAEFVGTALRVRGCEVDVAAVTDRPDPARYDAVVVGSAVHDRALLPAATRFAADHRDRWPRIPVWLFSVGIGPSLRGPLGRALPGRCHRGSRPSATSSAPWTTTRSPAWPTARRHLRRPG
ncbi:flavodoxin domain-containing protein [Pseudonocardia zijingensis]|uniref:Flavodoxin-like domain-containing protein n=1 Tax=Pseudonocardia zijingensis TaxID=153376 RepID=A0ABN1P3S1_9PSEU